MPDSLSAAPSVCSNLDILAMAPARVLTFQELKEAHANVPARFRSTHKGTFTNVVHLVEWRHLEDGTILKAPRFTTFTNMEDPTEYTREPLLLNLTPGDDEWLRIKPGVDYLGNVKGHHEAVETQACKVFFELPPELAQSALALDEDIMQKAMKPEDVGGGCSREGEGFTWLPMVRSENQLLANIVLEGSDALTKLCFIDERGEAQQGEGLEFFKAQLGSATLDAFSCKVWAEIQFLHVRPDVHRKSVGVKVHMVAFAKTPKEEVAALEQHHIDAFVRAAKRIKVRRL